MRHLQVTLPLINCSLFLFSDFLPPSLSLSLSCGLSHVDLDLHERSLFPSSPLFLSPPSFYTSINYKQDSLVAHRVNFMLAFTLCFTAVSRGNQGCQFCSVPSGMAETFRTNSKNETKWNKFHLILNLGPFRKFRPNSSRNVPVSFRLFRFGQKILF